jgi:hypothetical protein
MTSGIALMVLGTVLVVLGFVGALEAKALWLNKEEPDRDKNFLVNSLIKGFGVMPFLVLLSPILIVLGLIVGGVGLLIYGP